ncbi:MAG: ADP-ribosylglycohydrolase family protein [Ruminococcaceae bacterium]|nr:ADP-ribosylglycohydrolase family protein [Oscillospiraceae bacterium]
MNNDILYDKIYACWLGKNIGGTLGEPVEGALDILNLTSLPDTGENPLPNDDLDLQLVNLHALEEYGFKLTASDFSKEWAEHVYFPFDEYGYAIKNIRMGIGAPLSGKYDNPFTDCMGAPIRSELWAAIAAGKPEVAAYFALQDAQVDHAGGEGVWGEIFYAVLESMAFNSENKVELIEKALSYIDSSSLTYCAVKDTLDWFLQGVSYDEIRDKILASYKDSNFTHAPQNIAFTMVGFLYGNDFVDSLLKAVNLGYDTDCTGATLGALLGIMYGTKYIPKEWVDAIGTNIVVSAPIRGLNFPKTLDELTQRTIKLSQKLELENNFNIEQEWDFDVQKYTLPFGSRENNISVYLCLEDGLSFKANEKKKLSITLVNNSDYTRTFGACFDGAGLFKSNCGEAELILEPKAPTTAEFEITASDSLLAVNECKILLKEYNEGNIWCKYPISVVLFRAVKWIVDNEEVYTQTNTIKLNSGKHTVSTAFKNPKKRTVKLICACNEKYTLCLDGKTVISCDEKQAYIPAFHRCPENQFATLCLDEGIHNISINIYAEEEATLSVLPVANDSKKDKSGYYYFIDCEMLI